MFRTKDSFSSGGGSVDVRRGTRAPTRGALKNFCEDDARADLAKG
jgi:hypothetical protein